MQTENQERRAYLLDLIDLQRRQEKQEEKYKIQFRK